MSGYGGNGDLESEHALILAENGVEACQSMLRGSVLTNCRDCGETIPTARRQFAIKLGHKCHFCVDCQSLHDKPNKVKMLVHIL
jgi:RNA polymerase-binding transcription factor DksA